MSILYLQQYKFWYLTFYQNDEWKAVRKRFNPGFAPQHLMTLLPVILDKAEKYLKILNHFASTGEAFSLDHHTTNLTFDIIGAVSMGEDVNAQHLDPNQQSHLIRMFKELIKSKKLLKCNHVNYY